LSSRRENIIFSKKLAKVLRKKGKLEGKKRVIDNLKRQQKLSEDEFWQVYESIWQKGPEVKYQNPHKWIDSAK
jgi:hypothetical protein